MGGKMLVLVLLVVAALALAVHAHPLRKDASSSDDWECDPLVPGVCAFPFPNNFFRDSATGKLNITTRAIPMTHLNQSIDPQIGGWTDLDGFSPIPMIMAQFPDLDMSSLPRWWNVERSMSSDSPTVLINADNGQRIPHWCELDHSSDQQRPQGYDRALILWPAERLNNSATYVVGFRNLNTTRGDRIAASPAFASLRDGSSSLIPSVNTRRQRYNSAIFPALAQQGFRRSSLVLAWEFTVMSTHTITNRLVTIRDDAFKRTQDGISFSIEHVEEKPRAGVARQLRGVMKVPWYLNQEAPGMSVRMAVKDGDPNTPVYNGEGAVQFLVIVPESLANNGTRGAIMQYGHGLFGSMSELETGYLDDEANRYGYVLAATNWLGMCYEDEVPVASIIAEDLSNFPAVPDRSHQGYLHHITRDPLPNTPAHTVIGHYGLGDAQVTWLGMLTIGRSVGAHMYKSNVREANETLYGFDFISDDTTLSTPGQNLVQGWDFGAPPVPPVNIPAAKSTDAHEKPRRTMTAQEQTHRFLTQGVIYNACNGPCHGDGGGL
ncbi:hypothetical protein PTSG_10625 [Salpingoeca rosetta]|uniref:Uncharacterized protein n=1 Tax=Salpingoeca rosetta (strain ATCC 50818 / BSB-021) TaxID=946362 RepID=F2URW5_SALR5|nr:uncharacterized protein PTSG_10625 [Salpingoeca rosetta]EGD80370.1 hypothetical protein PTSG_10625 [Salpingoeca rosetta]|eukprot:XP_004988160.1 hypothetical protein PTSG_10625 [Salpingoeca rosetta]